MSRHTVTLLVSICVYTMLHHTTTELLQPVQCYNLISNMARKSTPTISVSIISVRCCQPSEHQCVQTAALVTGTDPLAQQRRRLPPAAHNIPTLGYPHLPHVVVLGVLVVGV